MAKSKDRARLPEFLVATPGDPLTVHYSGDDKKAARAAVQANPGSVGARVHGDPGLHKVPKPGSPPKEKK